MNLTQYLYESEQIDERLASVISDIASASKQIAHDVARSGLLGLHGGVGVKNVQGEQVQILDERSNDYMKKVLSENDDVVVLASEEEETVVVCGESSGYGVAFDPLDGSANIDINASVGTIFSVLPADSPTESVFLQTAEAQVAAGYVLYGSSTVMVFSTGNGVYEFTLDHDAGEYIQTGSNIQIPQDSGFIAFNSYVLPKMDKTKADAYQKLLDDTKRSQRWMGAMVGDVHRTLMKGGFFAYPATGNQGEFKGKLRLQYEAKPMGWLVEQAGGKAILDDKPLSDLHPTELHQRVSVEIGDAKTIERYLSYL